jgi:hypothetical protein
MRGLGEIFTSGGAFMLGIGNLRSGVVSNAGRTRATSHPCERGAGFLKKYPGAGAAKNLDAFARTILRGGV